MKKAEITLEEARKYWMASVIMDEWLLTKFTRDELEGKKELTKKRDYKEFKIDMVVAFSHSLSPDEDSLLDMFIHWIERHGGSCGGSIKEYTEEDYKSLEDNPYHCTTPECPHCKADIEFEGEQELTKNEIMVQEEIKAKLKHIEMLNGMKDILEQEQQRVHREIYQLKNKY